MGMFKSTLIKKGNIDYTKQFNVETLVADQKMLEMHAQRIKGVYKNANDDFIRSQIDQIILKENAFNQIMTYITSLYEYKYDEEEVKTLIERLKAQFNEPESTKITQLAQRLIQKGLIFEQLAIENNIVISDEQTKDYLDTYYKNTNQPINEFLNDKNKFNEIKSIILEEYITQWLIQKFKVWVDLKTLVRFGNMEVK